MKLVNHLTLPNYQTYNSEPLILEILTGLVIFVVSDRSWDTSLNQVLIRRKDLEYSIAVSWSANCSSKRSANMRASNGAYGLRIIGRAPRRRICLRGDL